MSVIDVDVGWPGAVHDSRVFENSELAKRIEGGALDTQHISVDGAKIPLYVVADAGYTLQPSVITPVKTDHNLTAREIIFNFRQSSTRMPAEMGFGYLKGMWRLLTSEHGAQVSLTRRVRDICCCIILHNILIAFDGLMDDDDMRNLVYDLHLNPDDYLADAQAGAAPPPRLSNGKLVRNAIIKVFCSPA